MRRIKKASDNIAHANKNADKHKRRSKLDLDPSRSKGNDSVMVAGPSPPLIDAAAQSERRELIQENRELHVRLIRAERATQGLQ